MRILLDARLYGLENTGIGRYLVNLVDGLVEFGKSEDFEILLRKKYFDKLDLPKNWHKVLVDIPHYSFEEQIKLPSLINTRRPDLVHFPHFNVPVFWRGKFVVTIYDMTMHEQGFDATKLPKLIYLLKRIPYKMVFRSAVVRSKMVIVPSLYVAKRISAYFALEKAKVEVIYPGYSLGGKDLKSLTGLKEQKEKYFLYVGNVYPHKNLETLVKAILHLNKVLEVPAKLVVVCPRNEFESSLKNQIFALGAKDYVELTGFVSDGELSSLYKNSLALVYPSKSEGFGFQGLEAFSHKALVACSDLPVFKEVYGDSAIYFNQNSPEDTADKLLKVVNMESGQREKIISTYPKVLKRYSWEKTAKETLKVYKKALEVF